MIVFEEFTVAEIFAMMDAGRTSFEFQGVRVKLSSDRMRLFHSKGIQCVSCEAVGQVFRLEAHNDKDGTPHLNLYGARYKRTVLFTKDHIFPKSRGGRDLMENYQTMCQPCNSNKSNKVDTVFDAAFLDRVAGKRIPVSV